MPEIDIKYWSDEIKEIDLENEHGIEREIEPEIIEKIEVEKQRKIVIENEEIKPVFLALGLFVFLMIVIGPFILYWWIWL